MLYVFPEGWTMRVGKQIRYHDFGAGEIWVQYLLRIWPDGRRETVKYGGFVLPAGADPQQLMEVDGEPFPTMGHRRLAVRFLQQLHAQGHCRRLPASFREGLKAVT